MLQPDGKALTALMESLIRDAAGELAPIRGKLKARAESPKGLTGARWWNAIRPREWRWPRAMAIAAMDGLDKAPASYETLIRTDRG